MKRGKKFLIWKLRPISGESSQKNATKLIFNYLYLLIFFKRMVCRGWH